jgi:ABC-type transporter Mla subunit MlaD
MSTSTNNLAHLDSTLNSLAGGLHEARHGATRSINSWIDTLKGSADSKLGGVAHELENLKGLLDSPMPDTTQLTQSLNKLGEQTTKAAAGADGATADKLQQLGQMLSSAAGQLK